MLPDCEAVMVQFPEVKKVTMTEELVQTVAGELANATGRPELAVAARVTVVPMVTGWIDGKLMVCVCAPL